MRRLAAQYPRYGYRRIRIFLKHEGHVMSTIARIAPGARPACKCRGADRAVAVHRPRLLQPTAMNHVWA